MIQYQFLVIMIHFYFNKNRIYNTELIKNSLSDQGAHKGAKGRVREVWPPRKTAEGR